MLGEIYREHGGRVIATLARSTRDLTLAEDAFQDAVEVALQQWSEHGDVRHSLMSFSHTKPTLHNYLQVILHTS